MAESYGITTVGTIEGGDFVASLRQPRQIDATIKKVGAGAIYARGTFFSKDTDGSYIKHDGTKPIAGVSNEAIDTTGGDVKSYLLFDLDVDIAAVFSATAIAVTFDSDSLINIIEVK